MGKIIHSEMLKVERFSDREERVGAWEVGKPQP